MIYEIIFSGRANKDLWKLGEAVRNRIILKLDHYLDSGRPLTFAKRLKARGVGNYCFRVGVYRVIFDLSEDGEICILTVLKVGHRKNIYLD